MRLGAIHNLDAPLAALPELFVRTDGLCEALDNSRREAVSREIAMISSSAFVAIRQASIAILIGSPLSSALLHRFVIEAGAYLYILADEMERNETEFHQLWLNRNTENGFRNRWKNQFKKIAAAREPLLWPLWRHFNERLISNGAHPNPEGLERISETDYQSVEDGLLSVSYLSKNRVRSTIEHAQAALILSYCCEPILNSEAHPHLHDCRVYLISLQAAFAEANGDPITFERI